MKRVSQENQAYCGPAVLVMLASFLGIQVSQKDLVTASGLEKLIFSHGMKLSELEKACRELMPQLVFWYKREATLSELEKLVNQAKYPIGVEWQGTFDTHNPNDRFEDEDEDPGHYSVVTGISQKENWITLADPYFNRGVDKQFTVLEFKRRWWDINKVVDQKSGKLQEIDDYQALFLLTPKDVQLSVEGLLRGDR